MSAINEFLTMSWHSFRPYVTARERRANAAKQAAGFFNKGLKLSPVRIQGRDIARTFWGKAWCTHLESFSDFANRLPRGRTYLRNGSVIDLQIAPGRITAKVMGSSLYEITVSIAPLGESRWKEIKAECSGKIDSLVELLQGRLSNAVLRIITDRDKGLFPTPSEIKKSCSCPDWADLCKHLAAVLYGVGSRLDQEPELLFLLRGADHLELVGSAAESDLLAPADRGSLADSDLAEVFGIDIAEGVPARQPQATKTSTRVARSRRKESQSRRKSSARSAAKQRRVRSATRK
jgi:uncharacterized Zn finger protein